MTKIPIPAESLLLDVVCTGRGSHASRSLRQFALDKDAEGRECLAFIRTARQGGRSSGPHSGQALGLTYNSDADDESRMWRVWARPKCPSCRRDVPLNPQKVLAYMLAKKAEDPSRLHAVLDISLITT